MIIIIIIIIISNLNCMLENNVIIMSGYQCLVLSAKF